MKRNKLIFITKPGKRLARQENISWCNIEDDTFFYGNGISHFIAESFIKKQLNFEIEIWRTDDRVNALTKRNVKGFLGKVYPYKSFMTFPYSIKFLLDLKKEAQENNLVLWFDGVRSHFYIFITFFFRKKPMIAHAMGGANFRYKYGISKKIKYYISYLLERQTFSKKLDLAILPADGEFNNFPHSKIAKQYVVGIDFEMRWKISNKKEARRKLGLPLDEKIILQMGRAYSFKGTQITINAWNKYLKKDGVLLYLTGIHETDEHFELVKNSGCNYRGFIDTEDVPLWLAAADVYVYPPFDEITLSFAGVGYAPFEALACGTPIVCTTARFFQFYNIEKEEYEDFVKIPSNTEDVALNIKDLLENPVLPEICRSFVYKHFNNDFLFEKMKDDLLNTAPDHFMPKKMCAKNA